jgi:hypothetical protein
MEIENMKDFNKSIFIHLILKFTFTCTVKLSTLPLIHKTTHSQKRKC